ncbi:hypothetical protein AAG570_006094 [Ranatra chinensis]|uniref:Uncharacterized protein n=1 Tax=Ranatra chinensis TaxID=642074 RepID=A0ABD0YFG3_9HEMI
MASKRRNMNVVFVLLDTSKEATLQWTTYPYGPQANTPGDYLGDNLGDRLYNLVNGLQLTNYIMYNMTQSCSQEIFPRSDWEEREVYAVTVRSGALVECSFRRPPLRHSAALSIAE